MTDWAVTVDALRFLGYELRLTALHPDFDSLPVDDQCDLWVRFHDSLNRCRMECAWKGGGHCLADDCPRRVLVGTGYMFQNPGETDARP